jgi:E3 ubiquitin-protein ligase MARCH6
MRNLATWMRFCLVCTVWLGCLPYAIRQVWRLLFWFSDGGWPSQYLTIDPSRNSTTVQALEVARQLQLATSSANGTSPATPFHAAQTTPASVAGLMEKLVGFLIPFSQTTNSSSGADPLAAGLFQSIYYGLGLQSPVISADTPANISASQFVMNISPAVRTSSLLSDINFLKNLTRFSYANELIIAIAEGYIITILVVVSFILVFLIREWVVQQQPNINMGAGFNAEFAAPDRAHEPVNQQDAAVAVAVAVAVQPPRGEGPIEIPDVRPGGPRHDEDDVGHSDLHQGDEQLDPADAYASEVVRAYGVARPTAVRDALTPAAEIQRELEEPRRTADFLEMWRRSESRPEEVLKMIERENKGDEMRYWVNAMKILRAPQEPETGQASSSSNFVPDRHLLLPRRSSGESLEVQTGSEHGSASGESWIDVPRPLAIRDSNIALEDASRLADRNEVNIPTSEKGKGKAKEEYPEPLSPMFTSSVRPRAVSDGPQMRENISPLANNNWSFRNIPNDTNVGGERSWPTENKASAAGILQSPMGDFAKNSAIYPRFPSDTATNSEIESGIAQERRALKAAENLLDQEPIVSGKESDPTTEGPVNVIGQDGVTRTSATWDDVFAMNHVDSDNEELLDGTREENPFAADTTLPPPREPIVARPAEPQGLLANLADWLWGGVDGEQRPDDGANDEHIVQDLAAEPPFVPVANREIFDQAQNFVGQDREVVDAAIAAGLDPNDPDAIEDAEDFEGIMELVGMRGPIYNLIQNALFSAFLLALTVAFGVWIPYQIGRVFLLLAANPGPACKLPMRLLFWFAAFVQDVVVSVVGVVSYVIIRFLSIWINNWSVGIGWANGSLRLSREAIDRIMEGTISSLLNFTDAEIFAFSAASHESLLFLKYLITDTIEDIGRCISYVFIGDYTLSTSHLWPSFLDLVQLSYHVLAKLPGFLARPDTWVISLDYGQRAIPLDLELSVWGTVDRIWATLAGYTALSLLGAMYVRKGSPFSNGQAGRDWEATIIDLLNQAGGVMKVILIISIEMLVFPLYCGLLLDAALLPLFENATLMSRLLFTINSPFTSIFVHWFVGTCYMFHFALFVSMCRKIMRKGVLCMCLKSFGYHLLTFIDFIRDPDDPTFHPVRDVLERNVATQLRKILFSALVYGALVVVCLGGVVWGLVFAFDGVLPIHWSSNEPVLEFPVDLLFYNFLMPLAVKFFKPSDGLHAMYSWWFRQCARMLRLTWFLFDERKQDEEGHVVRRSWKDLIRGFYGDPLPSFKVDDPTAPFVADPGLNAYVMQDGRYVRAPASDQVRVKKGYPIFLDVDQSNNRLEGQADRPAGDANWDSDLYKQVYIPPNFRLRIFAFIVSIWLFAALTGVCITIVPLVFGREIFSMIIPTDIRKNDVYAFSIGIYILGSALYMILHARHFITYLIDSFSLTAETPGKIIRQTLDVMSRIGRIAWTYSAVLFLLPTLCAFITEFYIILPLHTYFAPAEPHTIHFVQSWTLGLLYVKLTTRIIQCYPGSRLATSLRLIIRDGYFNPDARLATRSFILPATVVLSTALFWPWLLARITILSAFKTLSEQDKILVYRYVYPAVLASITLAYLGYLLGLAVRGWRMKIRDEVYLIGERLHNFGERKAGSGNTGVGLGVRRIDT